MDLNYEKILFSDHSYIFPDEDPEYSIFLAYEIHKNAGVSVSANLLTNLLSWILFIKLI